MSTGPMGSVTRQTRRSSRRAWTTARRPGAGIHPLERRLLLSGTDPTGRNIVNESHEDIAGFRIDYEEQAYGDTGAILGSLWIYGPDTDDTIRISRNTSLPRAIDFDFNGTLKTIDLDKLVSVGGWGISAGGGKNRIEVTFAAEDQDVSGFSGFQLYGGPGDDEIINGDTSAALRGEGGNDVLRGGAARDHLEGGEGVDKLYGGPGDDLLMVGYATSFPPHDLAVEEGEVYDGGPGDDLFQVSPAPAVPLPDGGQAPEPSKPETRPDGSEPYPTAPALTDPNPTHGLALDEAFGDAGKLTVDLAHLDRVDSVEPLPAGKFLVGGFTRSPVPDSGDEGDAGFLLRVNTDGTLDRSFGVNGVVLSRFFGEGITDIVVQSDGKILAAGMEWVSFEHGGGDLVVARFNPDGSVDGSFGDGGRAAVDFAGGNDRDARVALGPDGEIVLAGAAGVPSGSLLDAQGYPLDYSDVGVARLFADGTLDTRFGEGGKVTFDFRGERQSANDQAVAVAVTSEGKVYLSAQGTGYDLTGAGRTTSYLMRLNADGAPDAGFSGDGMICLYDPDRVGGFGNLVPGADGGVVTVLDVSTASSGPRAEKFHGAMLARYRADGSPDPSFGENGLVAITAPGGGTAGDLRQLADGALAVTGRAGDSQFAATFDPADGHRLRFASAQMTLNPFKQHAFVGSGGEVLLTTMKQFTAGEPYHYDSDVLISRLNVVDEVGKPIVNPGADPVPHHGPGPTPGPTPPPGPAPEPGPTRAPDPATRPRPVRLLSAPALSATFAGKRAVSNGTAYTFRVTYRADDGSKVDLASLGRGDALVSGPAGFADWPELVKTRANKAGTKVTATYRVAAPGGAFDAADNGAYTVRLPQGGVSAARASAPARAGRAAAMPPTMPGAMIFSAGDDAAGGQALGGFVVRARARATPAASAPVAAPATHGRPGGARRAAEALFSNWRVV